MKTPSALPEDRVRIPRQVEQQIAGKATSDGAGVKLTRLLGQALQRRLDPFLLFDAFGSDIPDDYIGGFPDHPHRGFETVTYMRCGRMRHRDSAGHEGLLEAGGVQWMTAGRGIIHAEMPEQDEGRMAGFQLWLNLPAQDKHCAPWYRDYPAAELPGFVTATGVQVTVIAGTSHGVVGPVTRPHTAPLYLDLDLPTGTSFTQGLPERHNAFVYVETGALRIGETDVPANRLAILANTPAADGVTIQAAVDTRALFIAGQPLHEPIARYGPFVMNTEQEIYQAISDYRSGKLAGE